MSKHLPGSKEELYDVPEGYSTYATLHYKALDGVGRIMVEFRNKEGHVIQKPYINPPASRDQPAQDSQNGLRD